MDQGGGCCIVRYAGGAYDVSKMDRIILRFHPIAPKPASCDGTAAASIMTSENSSRATASAVKRGRGTKMCTFKDSCTTNERKNYNNKKRKRKFSKCMSTLALLPEAPDVKEPPPPPPKRGFFLSFEKGGGVVSRRRAVVGSWVRVECVTDAWLMGRYVDEERVRNLYVDMCPGFILDGLNKVRWTNAAYQQMVLALGNGTEGKEVAVWVVVEDVVVLPVGCAAFTCRVRVLVTCEKQTSSTTVPCDVWKLDCGGGFAWGLDTTAILSLWTGR